MEHFTSVKKIIDKYGLVKTEDMEDVNETYDENLTIELLKNKIKVDSLILIGVTDIEEKKKIKKDLLYEAYCFLSKIYGNPPTTINIEGELLTPTEFKDKYLKNYLNDYITVTTLSKEALFESYSFIPSVYLEDKEKIIKLSKEEFKSAIVSQLKDEISVWFSAELSTAFDSKNQILDYNAYKFNEYLNIKEVNKNEKMRLDIIDYDHAMCITGVLIENNEIIQYKVDNSYGKYGKFKGNLIMTSSFLDNCVITAVINKKYITKKDKDM